MRAIQVHEPGAATVLRYEETATPEPACGEVLIRLRAAGVNHRDIWVRQGAFGGFATPRILGSDGAGEIEALGDSVEGLQVGQRVVINPGMGCGICRFCLSGQQPSCAKFRIFDGTYAEYVRVPQANVVPMPGGLTFAEAASIGVPFITAEDFLHKAAAEPGMTVLLWAANGGLGLATLQLAKRRGLRVIAVVRSSFKQTDRLRQFGADEIIRWDAGDDVVGDIMNLTQQQGVDITVDSLGHASFDQSLAVTRRGGVVVAVGSTTGGLVNFELGRVFRRRQTILGAYLGSSAILPRLLPLFARGDLVPVIDHTFPLEQADQAHEHLETSSVLGKVILEI